MQEHNAGTAAPATYDNPMRGAQITDDIGAGAGVISVERTEQTSSVGALILEARVTPCACISPIAPPLEGRSFARGVAP